jgi:hypothetical protein
LSLIFFAASCAVLEGFMVSSFLVINWPTVVVADDDDDILPFRLYLVVDIIIYSYVLGEAKYYHMELHNLKDVFWQKISVLLFS